MNRDLLNMNGDLRGIRRFLEITTVEGREAEGMTMELNIDDRPKTLCVSRRPTYIGRLYAKPKKTKQFAGIYLAGLTYKFLGVALL